MRYRLVVLTHGPDLTLSETVRSFDHWVRPFPEERILVCDGPVPEIPLDLRTYFDQVYQHDSAPQGFCHATREAFGIAGMAGSEFVFYLEHDFRFTRDVDLGLLAEVLKADPMLAQMALIRQPVNTKERAAGGLVESYSPGTFEWGDGFQEWLIHRAYFTTNPSLMRSEFLRAHPFPTTPQCEGLYGAQLRADGFAFGAWGSGEPWVTHFGERTGRGY